MVSMRDFSDPKYDPYREPDFSVRLAERFKSDVFFKGLVLSFFFLLLVIIFIALEYDNKRALRYHFRSVEELIVKTYAPVGVSVACDEYMVIGEQKREYLCQASNGRSFVVEAVPPLTFTAFLLDPLGGANFTDASPEKLRERQVYFDSNPDRVRFLGPRMFPSLDKKT